MRSSDPSLTAFLQSAGDIWVADLWTITATVGTSNPNLPPDAVWRWTSSDLPVSYGGNTWLAEGPKLTRTSWSEKNTIEVPEMTLTLDAREADQIGGIPALAWIANGGFDGARVRLERALMPSPGQLPWAPILLFEGRVSTNQIARGQASLTIKGDSVVLVTQYPRNVYQAACIHSLYDAGCAILRDHYSWSNTVGAGSTVETLLPHTALAGMGTTPRGAIDPAAFSLGSVTFTGGACAGQSRGIRQCDADNGIQLVYALDALPAPGDPFTITYGCDHTQTVCDARFGNAENFRAYPYIPQAETSA